MKHPIKTGLIFTSIITLLVLFLWITSISTKRAENKNSLNYTKNALNDLLDEAQNNFTQSTAISAIPPLPISGDWLRGSADDPFIGPEDSEIVIVEFSDFECPFCKESFPAIREITAQYTNVKYIYRDFPVDEIHKDARAAAEAAACAEDQGLFWAYHDRLFQNQYDLSIDALINYANQTGLDMEAFLDCFSNGRFAKEVENDRLTGIELGVRGTPTWFINGAKVEGAITYEIWQALFEQL